MTPERTQEVLAAFRKRYPPLPPATLKALTPGTLRAYQHDMETQYLTWLEATAWADKNPEKK